MNPVVLTGPAPVAESPGPSPDGAPKYTSRIIKASALLDETRALLHLWDPSLGVDESLRRVRAPRFASGEVSGLLEKVAR